MLPDVALLIQFRLCKRNHFRNMILIPMQGTQANMSNTRLAVEMPVAPVHFSLHCPSRLCLCVCACVVCVCVYTHECPCAGV